MKAGDTILQASLVTIDDVKGHLFLEIKTQEGQQKTTKLDGDLYFLRSLPLEELAGSVIKLLALNTETQKIHFAFLSKKGKLKELILASFKGNYWLV